jgi:hypothetical protein
MGTAVWLFPSISLADLEVGTSVSAALNFKTGEYLPRVDPDTGFKFSNTTLDLTLTVFTDRFFVAVNHDAPIKEDYSVVNGGTIEVETTRLDQGITVGYDVYQGLNVFVGYKIGETELESVRTTGSTAITVNYKDEGPFAGLSYGYNFGAAGTVSGSVAYADFDGEIRSRNHITGITRTTGGTTSGLSYGIKWSKELRTGAVFAIGLKKNLYEFKDKDLAFTTSNDLEQDFDITYVQVSSDFK